jgi:vitamin B12 transporter
MFSCPIRFALLCSAGFSAWVQAQPVVLPEILITANRTRQSVEHTTAAVTVLDRPAIERSQAIDLPNLLKTLPGIQIIRNGGAGQNSSIFLRGQESDHVLVLIDGIKVGSATAGLTAWQFLPLSQIERIEVIRGPRASLYGSEAVGGVIQLFTRRAEEKMQAFSAGIGSERTLQFTAHHADVIDRTHYQIGLEHSQTAGYNACSIQNQGSGGCFTVEPDKDAHRQHALSAQVKHDFDQFTVSGQVLRSQGRTEYDSSLNNQVSFVQQVIGVSAEIPLNDQHSSRLQIGESRDEAENFGRAELPRNQYDTRLYTLSWQHDWMLSTEQLLTAGYDFHRAHVDSDSPYAVTRRDNHGVFAQYQADIQPLQFQISGRYDDNQQFGDYWTGHVSLGYDWSPTIRSFAAWGRAFKAPSFNELYFPNFGNPNLTPEQAQSWEIGLRGNYAALAWELSGFYTETTQLIATYFDANTGAFFPKNIAETTAKGIELAATWALSPRWSLEGQLDVLRAEDKQTGLRLPRRADYTGRFGLTGYFDRWQISTQGVAQSARYDDVFNRVNLPGYLTLEVLSEYRWSSEWTFKGKLSNLLDKDYEEARYFPVQGRAIFLSVHYRH